MLWLNLGIVDAISELKRLESVLHLLLWEYLAVVVLHRTQTNHTSSTARIFAASITAFVWLRVAALLAPLAGGGYDGGA